MVDQLNIFVSLTCTEVELGTGDAADTCTFENHVGERYGALGTLILETKAEVYGIVVGSILQGNLRVTNPGVPA